MIVSTVVRVVGTYGNKNEGGRDSPTEDDVLQFRKHAKKEGTPKRYFSVPQIKARLT